jgi:mycofactocin system FadH/OYE family oxidoreductase 1
VKLGNRLQLGVHVAPSSVLFGPHPTNLGDGRALSDRHTNYYRRRAAGGAGIIVVEEASVHPSDWPYERAPLASDCGPGWASIAEACSEFETLVLAGLGHSGGQGSSAYSQLPLWAPSHVPEVNSREVPKSMEPHEIEELLDCFVRSSVAAVAAGCHGVEINIGQSSLLRQFLSGLTNHRSDGAADGLALVTALLGRVRIAIPDSLLALRLCADELAPWAGIVPERGAEIAAALAEHADLITVVRGSIYSMTATRPDCHEPAGFNRGLAAHVAAAVRAVYPETRIALQGSVVDVAMAEEVLAAGEVDCVEMTRALIADASLVAKATAGEVDRVRPCLLCNQTCMVRDARNPIISCVVDPTTGFELLESEPGRSQDLVGLRVVVVGAGPGGMEAARCCALAGATVQLHESSSRVGGALASASVAAGRGRLNALVSWLEQELNDVGVEVLTSSNLVAADEVLRNADVIIVATGSRNGSPDYVVQAGAAVMWAREALEGANINGPVCIWDPIGGPIGISVAETIRSQGVDVTLVTPDNIAGNELSRSGDLAPANTRLQQVGAKILRRATLVERTHDTVVVTDRFSGASSEIEATTLIDAGHRLAEDSLFHELTSGEPGGSAAIVLRVGDAVAPRTAAEAMIEARRVVAAARGQIPVSDGVPMIGTVH